MDTLYRDRVGSRLAVAISTDIDDGDIRPDQVDPATLRARQRRVTPEPWVMVDEVHGVAVHSIRFEQPTLHADTVWPVAGVADVVVTSEPDVPLAIWAADCAPLAMFGIHGTTVAVHAGWKGLAAGVIGVALDQFTHYGDRPAVAVLGPTIHPCCYEFGLHDLRAVAAGIGAMPDDITSRTTEGARALDVVAAVRIALRDQGPPLAVTGQCTGCGGRWFSHRRRADTGRHALVAWTTTTDQTVRR